MEELKKYIEEHKNDAQVKWNLYIQKVFEDLEKIIKEIDKNDEK